MIKVNIAKAQAIAHEARRAARSAEFAPLDIKATIPSEAAAAEEVRSAIRTKYVDMQAEINEATEVAPLKTIMESLA
jgi:hypothetical protein